MSLLYRIAYILFGFILKYIWRIEIINANILKNLPCGRLIIAANHQSLIDPIVIGVCINRQIYYMAKEELFHIPALAFLIKRLGSFPVKRNSGDIEALNKAARLLNENKIIGMFPEGRRSYDAALLNAHAGIGYLALKTKSAILPVALKGTSEVLPKGSFIPKFAKIKIIIGEVINLEKYYNQELKKELFEEIKELVMSKIKEMLERCKN